MDGFYTLDEAAKVLGMSPDELNRMAQRREVRAFSDRGAWKFRSADIDDMAKKRSGGQSAMKGRSQVHPGTIPAPRPTEMELFDYDLSHDGTEPAPIQEEMFDAPAAIAPPSAPTSLHRKNPVQPPANKPTELELFDYDLTQEVAVEPVGMIEEPEEAPKPPVSGPKSQLASPSSKSKLQPPPSSKSKLQPPGDIDLFDYDIVGEPASPPPAKQHNVSVFKVQGDEASASGKTNLRAKGGTPTKAVPQARSTEVELFDEELAAPPPPARKSSLSAKSQIQPAPAPPPPKRKATEMELFDYDLSSDNLEVDLGAILPPGDSPSGNLAGPKSGIQQAGSEGEVRLVMGSGSNSEFELSTDAAPEDASSKSAVRKTGLSQPKSGVKLTAVSESSDDDVQLDFESASTVDDSMVAMLGKHDDEAEPKAPARAPTVLRPATGIGAVTAMEAAPGDEFELGADIATEGPKSGVLSGRMPTQGPASKAPASKTKLPSTPGKTGIQKPSLPTVLPTDSPFELSDADLQMPEGPIQTKVSQPSHSEFELSLADAPAGGHLNLGDDEDVDLGGLTQGSGASAGRAELSGINLHDPADSGISLEKAGEHPDSVDFELTLDGESSKKGLMQPTDSSEFELTVDESGALSSKTGRTHTNMKKDVFATNFDAPSESSGELVLEESGSDILPIDEESSDAGSEQGQKDIFESDFDLPALSADDTGSGSGMSEGDTGSGSGSDAVPLEELDTDLESSDFDLSMDELTGGSVSTEDESASDVVALEEVEGAATARRRTVAHGGLDASEISEVDELLSEDELISTTAPAVDEDDDDTSPAPAAAPPADWGIFPIIMMLPCVLVMLLAGLMAYELVNGMWGYHTSSKFGGPVVRTITDSFTGQPTKE